MATIISETNSGHRCTRENTGPSVEPPLDPVNPHVSYKSVPGLPLLDSFTDPAYFTGAFPTLFPYGVGGHLGDARGNRPQKVSLQDFAKYAMLHHSHLYIIPFRSSIL
jgi:hypothetical protein